MKFLYTREKARDLKSQLAIREGGGDTSKDFEIADNTESFQEALQSALTKPEESND